MRGVYGLMALCLFLATTLNLQAADPGQPANGATAAGPTAASPAKTVVPKSDAQAADRPTVKLAATLASRSAPAILDPSPAPIPAAAPELIRQLDDASFDVRQAAAEQLVRLSREPEFAPALADHFQRLLCDEQTSFEVRTQLEDLMRNLPVASSSPPKLPSADVDHLLSLLDEDSFAVRTGAAERLKWLARNPAMICPLLETIKSRLAEADLSPASRQQLEPLWTKIHGAWLLSDSATWNFAPVSATQIAHWIDALEQPVPADHEGRSTEHETAARELLDLLVRPDTAAAVIRALDVRLADPQLESSAESRLREVYDWSRPALVAECWDKHSNQWIQHLLVGVPSLPPGAQYPSHFDRCDDHLAHCVSGSSLVPGDYDVGVAFLHPRQPGAFLQLVNLPTTQRRLAYEFLVEDQTDTQRLADISARTLHRIIEKRKALDDDDMALLDLLDTDAVSRFVGPYFEAVVDGPRDDYFGDFKSPSRHGLLCLWLAIHGTHEAIPGLVQAIEAHRIYEPNDTRPFQLSWVAALSIARRDPWPGEDNWLAQRVPCTDRMELGSPADVGAIAAAELLSRHGEKLRDFGLTEVESGPLAKLPLQCYRFETADGREAVLRWWSHKPFPPE
jgi:hypothetical protein